MFNDFRSPLPGKGGLASLFPMGPASGWLGHHSSLAYVFCYGAGVAGGGALGIAVRPHGVPLLLRVAVTMGFAAYIWLMLWLLRLWVRHISTPCVRCESAETLRQFSRSRRPGPRFRGYHFIERPSTYGGVQIMGCTALTTVSVGLPWAWLLLVPVALFLAFVGYVASFHFRFGFCCPVCNPVVL